MKSYAETRFKALEIDLLRRAIELVDTVPSTVGERVRCHELARAVARCLGLHVQDGRFEAVEHSWLWCAPGWTHVSSYREFDYAPPVLDVYVPGCLPQVQLVDWQYWGLPYKRVYVPGPERNDIDGITVKLLVRIMSGKAG